MLPSADVWRLGTHPSLRAVIPLECVTCGPLLEWRRHRQRRPSRKKTKTAGEEAKIGAELEFYTAGPGPGRPKGQTLLLAFLLFWGIVF